MPTLPLKYSVMALAAPVKVESCSFRSFVVEKEGRDEFHGWLSAVFHLAGKHRNGQFACWTGCSYAGNWIFQPEVIMKDPLLPSHTNTHKCRNIGKAMKQTNKKELLDLFI